MFPPRSTFLALAALFCSQSAPAQTFINSTCVGRSQLYSDPNNWSPYGVPNNFDDRRYNVTIDGTQFMRVDTAATISNLTLGSSLPALFLDGRNLTVTGTTDNQMEGGYIEVFAYDVLSAVRFDAGTLTTFSNNALSGEYIIWSHANPATLQFKGANIGTLSDGSLTMSGLLSAVVDEFGNDALRNLARIDMTGQLRLLGRSILTNTPFRNDGTLHLYNGVTPTTFTAAAGLANFDSATRTLTGGVFELFGSEGSAEVELRFPGADIVNLASSILVHGGNARVADLGGNDGLRNLAHILPGGTLSLQYLDRTMGVPLRNDGVLSLDAYAVCAIPDLANFDTSTGTLSGGTFGIRAGSQLKFGSADIVHNGASITVSGGSTIEDLSGADALRNFAENLSGGEFALGNNSSFTASGDFTNAGRVTTALYLIRTRVELRPGIFTVPPGFVYLQTAGETVNDGYLSADHIKIQGGTFSGRGITRGDVTVTDATIQPGEFSTIDGDLTLSSGSRFRWGFTYADAKPTSGKVTLAGTLEIDIPSDRFMASNVVLPVLRSAEPLVGMFSNAPQGARIPTVDGKGSVEVIYDTRAVYVVRYHAEPPPAQLMNISSRAFLSRSADDPAGDRSVLIGGFIVVGSFESKEVVLRGLGPSLSGFGPNAVLADPVLELRSANGALLATNDNWADTQGAAISSSGLAPTNEREAAIRATLPPASYTVVLKEKTGLPGNGVVEIYDISNSAISKLANISSRGITDSGNLLIGGMIAGGDGQANAEVVVRALGPHMKNIGVANALDDPTLEVRDNNGVIVAFNDDWEANSEQLTFTNLTPFHDKESAMRLSIPRGNYTAIVRAKGDSGGVALVEFYDLRR